MIVLNWKTVRLADSKKIDCYEAVHPTLNMKLSINGLGGLCTVKHYWLVVRLKGIYGGEFDVLRHMFFKLSEAKKWADSFCNEGATIRASDVCSPYI